MGGLLIFFLGALYIWGAAKAVGLVEMGWAKTLLILTFVLIPTADAVYGRIKLQQMCEAEGGLKVYKTIENVDGFYEENGMPDNEWISKHGYKFVEGKTVSGMTIRKERTENGRIAQLENEPLKSKFGFGYFNDDLRKKYQKGQLYIYDLVTKEKIATLTNITFYGGWAERFIAGLYASTPNSQGCQIENYGSIPFIKSVLNSGTGV